MDNVTGLSVGRIVIGAAAYAAPELSLRAMMLDSSHGEATLFVRLFGVRDLALGVATLFARPQHQRAMLALGLLVDAGDAGAALLALRSGGIKPVVGMALTGAAAAAVGVAAAGITGRTG